MMKKTILNAIIAIAIVLGFLMYQSVTHKSKVEKWPWVEGVVEISFVKKEIKNIKLRFKPFIQYKYEVGNIEYKKIYYDTTSTGFLEESDALKITNRFPQGKEIVVHYNPDNPDESILAELQ